MSKYKLWVNIEGNCNYFMVNIFSSHTIYELQEKIHSMAPKYFDSVDAMDLIITKVDVDLRSVLEAIHAGTYRPDTNGEPPLEAIDTISQVWPQKPSNKNLHVFVTILRRISRPTLSDTVEQPSKKRKLDYDAPEYKAMNVVPSQFAKPSNFRKAMEQDEGRECYIHNRPITFDEVPLTLISPIFGRFSDDLFTLEKDFRSEDFAPARDLANMLSKLAKDEASRNGAFLDWLLKTLPSIERTKSSGDASLKPHEVRPRLLTAIIKGEHEDSRYDYATDGHVELGDNLLLVTESELELGEGSSNPHWQLMAYTRAYYMQKRCSYRVGRSCLPAVLIAHYGPCIDASAAIICPDGSVQVEALTPALRVDCDYRDNRQRNLLAGFVRALRNAFVGLKEFYESPSSPVSDPPGYRSHEHAKSIDRSFPYQTSYTDKANIERAFKYKLRLMQGALIFLAEHTEPEANAKPIVVKFTRTYSKVVHELLAGEGFAPELLAVEDLVGGWKMVVMEYLSGWVMLQEKPKEERPKYEEKLKVAMDIIHGRNFVHGDVRCPNILVSEDGDVKFIDFDHCGVDGEDVYPREWDHRFRQEDAKEGDLLRKYHDIWMFNRIFR